MSGWGLFAAAMVAVVFLPLLVVGLAAAAGAEPPAVPERENMGKGR